MGVGANLLWGLMDKPNELVDTMFHMQRPTAATPFTWTKSKEGSGQVRTSQEISETDEC